jgi:transposase-like protein
VLDEQKTLTEVVRYFSDEQNCINAVAEMRWVDGSPVCPNCNATQEKRNHYWLKTQSRWKCHTCRKQFSVKVGTIFEDSAITLDKWLIATWLLVNCKNGVSSYEISRHCGVHQKSAWFMLQRLRLVLKDEAPEKLGERGRMAPVQIDETHISGKPKNMHQKQRQAHMTSGENKAIVMGMIDTSTRQVRAMVIPNTRRETLQGKILQHVGWGSHLHTDEHVSYQGIDATHLFVHKTVNHMKEYVNGKVTTNAIENFWSLLKRTLSGTYVCVEPFHLDRYIDEQVFRFNNRKNMNDNLRFKKALSQVAGKRLTYKEVTGKVADRF